MPGEEGADADEHSGHWIAGQRLRMCLRRAAAPGAAVNGKSLPAAAMDTGADGHHGTLS